MGSLPKVSQTGLPKEYQKALLQKDCRSASHSAYQMA